MRIDVAAGIWFLGLHVAGRLADFPRSPVAVRTYSVRHRLTHFVATFRRSPQASPGGRASRHPLLLFAGLLAGAGPQPAASRQAGATVYLTGRTVGAAAAR
jgi:hypothetical protein